MFSFISKNQIKDVPQFNFDINDQEIICQEIIEDTLKVVILSDFMYYPFGVYKNNIDFCNHYPLFIDNSPSKKNSEGNSKYWSYSYKESTLLLLYSDDTERIEILESEIKDEEISLANNIKIGMSKFDFLEIFKLQESIEDVSRINVVNLESGLLGIWHSYFFYDNKLISIKIKTDYQY